MKDDSIRKIIFTGVIAALSYVVFTFLQIFLLSVSVVICPILWAIRPVTSPMQSLSRNVFGA